MTLLRKLYNIILIIFDLSVVMIMISVYSLEINYYYYSLYRCDQMTPE